MKYLSLIFVLIFALSVQAATFTVTRTDDRNLFCQIGDCSLREAVKSVNSTTTSDTIIFASGLAKITLNNEIVIDKTASLSIDGQGANLLTIDGGAGTNRIFHIYKANVSIKGVTLTGGGTGLSASNYGGAILAEQSSLVINGVHITGNSAISGGGGIYFAIGGDLQIINSTISNNTASGCGGFVVFYGNLSMVNSTISGNAVSGNGNGPGGAGFCGGGGNMTIRNSTIANNSSANFPGGGIHINSGTLNLGNTIVAGNLATNSQDIFIKEGSITSAGNNLIGSNTGVEAAFPSGNANFNQDVVGTDSSPVNPLLGALQYNGGTTPTHALLSGSPAINAGNNANSPSTSDQRGFARIVGGTVDIGAFEREFVTPCTYRISGHTVVNQLDFNYPVAGAPFVFNVQTQDFCDWVYPEFSQLPSWISNGQVEPNFGPARRFEGVFRGYNRNENTFYRVIVSISQNSGCTFTPSITSASVPATESGNSFTIQAFGGCVWHAVSNNDWLTINLGDSWSGSGTVGYIVAANPTSQPRTGTISVGSNTITVTQAANAKSRKRVRFF